MGKVCTFFGHATAPHEIVPILHETLVDLIEHREVDTFYIGNQGNFDFLVRGELKLLKTLYPFIQYSVVLAYLPSKKDPLSLNDTINTVFPKELDGTPRKFAIDRRNHLLLKYADVVITYVTHCGGGAGKFERLAEQKEKEVIRLSLKQSTP